MRGILMVPLAMLAACNAAGGQQRDDAAAHGSEKRDIRLAGEFDKIELRGAQNVIVAVGGPASARAEGEAGDLDRLELTVDGGTLRISDKREKGWSWGLGRDRKAVTVFVTVPSLSAASIAGSGDVQIDRVQGPSFAGAIAGSGDLRVAAMQVGNASFSVAGSGDISAAGSAASAAFSIAGSGDIDAGGLESRTAKVSVMGNGNVRAKAVGAADVTVMGSGDVELAGGAKCDIHKMGSGDVRCTG